MSLGQNQNSWIIIVYENAKMKKQLKITKPTIK